MWFSGGIKLIIKWLCYEVDMWKRGVMSFGGLSRGEIYTVDGIRNSVLGEEEFDWGLKGGY